MYKKITLFALVALLALLQGCATGPVQKFDYSKFRAENPRSVLIVPAVNHSVDVDAPDYYLSTISLPLAERGFYVFPINLVKGIMEENGLSDADMVHQADPRRLGELFGTDAVLYVIIERWDARYAVFSTTVTVEFVYVLKSAVSGEELWRTREMRQYSPDNSNSGGSPIAQLIAAAISAAVAKAAPNYIPLTKQANAFAVNKHHTGLPAGPYHPNHGLDTEQY